MAKILIQGRFVGNRDVFTDPYLLVEQAKGGILTLTRKNTAYVEKPLVVVPAEYFEPWSIHVVYWGAGEFRYVTDYAEVRDKDAFMRQHYGCREGIIAEVAWGATPSQCVVMTFSPAFYEGKYQRIDRADRSANYVEELIPGFAARRLQYTNARREMFSGVNMSDSLADLEKQVDLLTQVVVTLAQKHLDDDERPKWFDQFVSIFNLNDSTKFKTPEENIEAIGETKSNLRQAQQVYFSKKSQIPDAVQNSRKVGSR